MTDYARLAARLDAALSLPTPPVAIRFSDSPPGGATRPQSAVPAGCAFWQQGAVRALATTAEDHRFCSIGIYTHNLAGAPATQGGELQSALAAMQGLDYVRPEEVQALPVLAASARWVLYTPLAEVTEPPALVMVFAQAAQGLVLTEALARVDGAVPLAMGRPACALVPAVVNGAHAAASLGCCGARAYLDALTDDVALWGLPGERLEAYIEQIETLAKANAVLTRFHARRRRDIEAGGAPTVGESLAKLGV